jgi:hypothetical protein
LQILNGEVVCYSNLTLRNSQNLITTKTIQLKQWASQAPMAHTCNTSYSGGRDQQDCSSKPTQANSSTRPYLEKTITKKWLVEWLKVKALSLSPSFIKKIFLMVK